MVGVGRVGYGKCVGAAMCGSSKATAIIQAKNRRGSGMNQGGGLGRMW